MTGTLLGARAARHRGRRALLSVGSVLLTALAIGSAVLGPIFSEAVTNSYVVTRLQRGAGGARPGWRELHAPVRSSPRTRTTGRSRSPTPATTGPGASSTATSSPTQLSALRACRDASGRATTSARPRGRRGRCPSAPGEVLMLAGDVSEDRARHRRAARSSTIFEPRDRAVATRARRSTPSPSSAPTRPRSDDVLAAAHPAPLDQRAVQPHRRLPALPAGPAASPRHDTMQSLGAGAVDGARRHPARRARRPTPADLGRGRAPRPDLDASTEEVDGGTLVGIPDSTTSGPSATRSAPSRPRPAPRSRRPCCRWSWSPSPC